MDRVRIFIFMTAVCLLCYRVAAAQQVPQPEAKPQEQIQAGADKQEPNDVGEPNSAPARVLPQEVEQEFRTIKPLYEAEQREWERGDAERKLPLLDALQNRSVAEYEMLLRLARAENADKTATAIEELITSSKARSDEIREGLQDDRRRQRREELRAKREERRRRREDTRDERRRERRPRSRREEETEY